MALNIFEELDVAASGDKVDEGFVKLKDNWEDMDTELHNARGGEATLDARLDILTTGIIAGVKMWFYANAAPTGWTIISGLTDTLLSVKGGATYTTGATGSAVGSWTQAGHVHTMGTHTHTLSAHTHSAEHNHQWYDGSGGTDGFDIDSNGIEQTWAADGSTKVEIAGSTDFYTINALSVTGVPSSDTTDAVDPGDTNSGATANTWRPAASVGILATKD
jgi:hypothetical protein